MDVRNRQDAFVDCVQEVGPVCLAFVANHWHAAINFANGVISQRFVSKLLDGLADEFAAIDKDPPKIALKQNSSINVVANYHLDVIASEGDAQIEMMRSVIPIVAHWHRGSRRLRLSLPC